MNRLVRRYIILFFTILIPVVVSVLITSYGYNSEKFGQGAWQDDFIIEYLSFEGEYTTKDKIDKYMEYGINNQYYSYNPQPVFEKEVKSEADEKLFDFVIYRVIYDVDKKGTNRVQYVFFIYNVQYLKLRDLFEADEARRQEINDANVPTFSIRLHEVVDEEEETPEVKGVTQIAENQLSFPDYDSDVDYKSGKQATAKYELTKDTKIDYEKEKTYYTRSGSEGDYTFTKVAIPKDSELSSYYEQTFDNISFDDSFVKVFMGFVPFRELENPTKYDVKIEMKIATVVDDFGASISKEVFNEEMDLEVDPENFDYSNYSPSYQQDLKSAGYFKWVFKHYLWWISLLSFAVVGIITGSFYLIYRTEEKRIMLEQQTKRRKRK